MKELLKINIYSTADILKARQEGRQLCIDLNFELIDQTKLATAISEITRNVLQYGVNGMFILNDQSTATESIVECIIQDEGPGISDLEKALEHGYSTGGGLGVGLPGSKKLVHDFEITTNPQSTKVTLRMRRSVK